MFSFLISDPFLSAMNIPYFNSSHLGPLWVVAVCFLQGKSFSVANFIKLVFSIQDCNFQVLNKVCKDI